MNYSNDKPVIVIGGGLSGCEAAWQLAKRGIKVDLYEMRGVHKTFAHVTDTLAELVCSNSFRSDDITNAVGLLHEEMRMLDSIILSAADKHRIPAGSALAVDRVEFANEVQARIEGHENINVIREEVVNIPSDRWVIIATGPLTSDSLSAQIQKATGQEYLAFYDAIAPIIYTDSIDFSIAWKQSRYDKGEGKDYINLPMNEQQYYSFIEELKLADKISFN
jgi:methylenetetrahydrofolate--tRNA-(uracil-5-)-methyltransferase